MFLRGIQFYVYVIATKSPKSKEKHCLQDLGEHAEHFLAILEGVNVEILVKNCKDIILTVSTCPHIDCCQCADLV
jgi:hypothetical protein